MARCLREFFQIENIFSGNPSTGQAPLAYSLDGAFKMSRDFGASARLFYGPRNCDMWLQHATRVIQVNLVCKNYLQ